MTDLRQRLSLEFETLVSDKFSFLQGEYGYEQHGTRFPNLALSHGDECGISFGSSDLQMAVDVFLDFETYLVDVALFRSHDGSFVEHSVWGQVHLTQAVLLSALIEHNTADEEAAYVLPPSLPMLSWREKQRRFDARRTAIQENLEGVVQEAADRLSRFGGNVLRGDMSLFPQIQSFYREKQDAFLSSDGRRVQFNL